MSNRKENERTKYVQEKCQTLLTQMLRDEDNKYCVDCDAKGPRWASWNIGIFLCIRCAGIHRNLGVHISRVKSVNLDTWTPEQVISLQQMGNSRARAVYEAQLPDGFRRPQTDSALENFIRAKYEHKKYLAKEWVNTPAPKVDWNKEIDEEIERQKRKKKTGTTISLTAPDKKVLTSSQVKNIQLPAPKPVIPNNSLDLLSLSSPTLPTEINKTVLSADNDIFNNFLSATNIIEDVKVEKNIVDVSLDKQEADFFNQSTQNEKEKAKLTKDSIMALYGNPLSSNSFNNPNLRGFNNSNSFSPQQSTQTTFNNQYSAQRTMQFGQFGPIPGSISQPQSKSLECSSNNKHLFSMEPPLPQNFSDPSVCNFVCQQTFSQFPNQSFPINVSNITQSKTDSSHQKLHLEQVNSENVWQ